MTSDRNDGVSDLEVLCSTCKEGASQIDVKRPSAAWLISEIEKFGLDDQRTLLDGLLKSFKD